MSNPVRASETPYATEVTAGKTYYWCSCGKSQKQPLCDGSHKAAFRADDVAPRKT